MDDFAPICPSFPYDQDVVLKMLGKRIQKVRKERGLFQSHVAQMLNISQPYYSMIERGDRNIDFYLVWAICRTLGISLQEIDEMLMSEDEKNARLQKRKEKYEKCIRELLEGDYYEDHDT